jgi:hypothetical protein
MEEKNEALLRLAEKLDGMEEDVSSGEADFLESALKCLRTPASLSDSREKRLKEIYAKYFGDDDPDLAEVEELDEGADLV